MNNRIVDSVSTDQGDGQSQVQEQSGDGPGPASESKIEAAVHKGDIRKMPGSSMHDFPKKGRITNFLYAHFAGLSIRSIRLPFSSS